MINRKQSILKVIAGVVAIVLILCILYVTNAFVGNPISASMANKAIKNILF